MNPAILNAVAAFWNTRRLSRKLATRADVIAHQQRCLDRFLRTTIGRVSFYSDMRANALHDLPVMDKATVQGQFGRLNTAGVTLEEARAALDAGKERVRGLVVGQSTGTSGNRGVFVISEAERFRWLGVILAKTLPDVLFTRHKVALALPAYSQLYASAAESGRLSMRFFDLARGVDAWRDDLLAYAPDTIVAPPKVLRALAETSRLQVRHVFSGAEVLDLLDRQIIETAFGAPVREIYMATEGLFGVGCPHGVLHLAEDVVAFEWEKANAGAGLVKPLVTDFTRSTQVMARYRMNDLLKLRPEPCPCGSPLQAVESIEGRQDDVFELPGRQGANVRVTPDVLRNAVVDADRRILDFRVVQTHEDRITLQLSAGMPAESLIAAEAALKAALTRAGAASVRIDPFLGIETPTDRKLRRVRRDWRPKD